jgi:Uma2 family endonuclease
MVTDRSIKKWSLQEYHRLGEAGLLQDGRYELLGGEIVEMSPVGIRHKDCVSRLVRVLGKQIAGAAQLESQQPLVVGDEEPVPDVFLLRPAVDFYEGRHFTSDDVLLVIEVAESTQKTDQEVKVPKYALHGVPEAWVVDLNSDRVWVYRHPKAGVYTSIQAHDRGITLNPELLPQVRVTTDEILGRSL